MLDGHSVDPDAHARRRPIAGTFNDRHDREPDRAGHVHGHGRPRDLLRLRRRHADPRTDGTSWLDSGFLEGQLIKIGGDPTLYKINSFSSSGGGNLNVLTLTSTAKPASVGLDGLPWTQWAAIVTFTPGNYATPQTVNLLADPYFILPPGRQNLKTFAKQQHILSGIQGPLSVEGGTTNSDRSLHAAVLLPGEGNGPLFAVAAQPPEWQQIDTLNVYDDGSKQDQTGTLTSTALTGLSMGGDPGGILDFTYLLPHGQTTFPFGEPGVYPGRHQLRHRHRRPEHAHVLDRREPDDHRGPEHPPRPGQRPPDDRQHDGARPRPQPGRDAEPRSRTRWRHGRPRRRRRAPAAHRHVRRQQPDRLDRQGPAARRAVLVGRRLRGRPADHVHRRAVGHVHDRRLRQLELRSRQRAPPQQRARDDRPHIAASVSVSDSLQVTAAFDLTANKILRRDGLPWQSLGFTYGQQISIVGIPGTWTIAGFDNSIYGDGTALVLSGPALTPATNVPTTVAVTSRYRVSGTFNRTATTVMTFTVGTVAGSGLAVGQQVAITGVIGTRTITAISGNTLTLAGGPMIVANGVVGTVSLVRVGGDTIVVTGGASTTAAGGPGSNTCTADFTTCTPSPLVIYGDTSQDGLWYGGNPAGISLHNFGPKPLPHDDSIAVTLALVPSTPFGTITRSDGGSWITDGFAIGQNIAVDGHFVGAVTALTKTTLTLTFLTADFHPGTGTHCRRRPDQDRQRGAVLRVRARQPVPLRRQRRDRRATGLLECRAGSLPSIGITAYGGAGDDTIYGSQTGDILAGGSGNDTIAGGRGDDQIYGDSGVNLNVITRLLTIPTANASSYVNRDLMLAGQDLLYGDTPGGTSDRRFSAFDDVIFGDHGVIVEDVAGARDTTKPIPALPQLLQTTLRDRVIQSAQVDNGANDTIYGNGGEDILIGGTGDDAIDGGTAARPDLRRPRLPRPHDAPRQLHEPAVRGPERHPALQHRRGDRGERARRRPAAARPARAPDLGRLPDHHRRLELRRAAPLLRQRLHRRRPGRRHDLRRARHRHDPGRQLDRLHQPPGRRPGHRERGLVHDRRPSGRGDPPAARRRLPRRVELPAHEPVGRPARDRWSRLHRGRRQRPRRRRPAADRRHLRQPGPGRHRRRQLRPVRPRRVVHGGERDRRRHCKRPDGSDLIFGGSGVDEATDADRLSAASLTNAGGDQTATGHANDSDAIVADNGDIFRIVGVNGHPYAPPAYASFYYDNYSGTKIVVRGERADRLHAGRSLVQPGGA